MYLISFKAFSQSIVSDRSFSKESNIWEFTSVTSTLISLSGFSFSLSSRSVSFEYLKIFSFLALRNVSAFFQFSKNLLIFLRV